LINGLQRGTVVSKGCASDLSRNVLVYYVTVRCHDDTSCQESLVVTKEMWEETCIEGLGHDVVLEYGTVLRVVGPAEVPKGDEL